MAGIKKAIIIAAGEGKRLRPVTLQTPKPLLPVNGKRIMDAQIEALKANGVSDIYIVTGYKKELFREIYGEAPDIHLIENPDYLNGNNITSIYYARQYLPGAFVLEADILVRDPGIFRVDAKTSGYLAAWKTPATEWLLEVEGKRIKSCDKDGRGIGYQLFGISVWNERDGSRLAEDVRRTVETEKNTGIYWDEIPLGHPDSYHLEVKEIPANALQEIDNLAELIQIDAGYARYQPS